MAKRCLECASRVGGVFLPYGGDEYRRTEQAIYAGEEDVVDEVTLIGVVLENKQNGRAHFPAGFTASLFPKFHSIISCESAGNITSSLTELFPQ
jgi:hypothetical protein